MREQKVDDGPAVVEAVCPVDSLKACLSLAGSRRSGLLRLWSVGVWTGGELVVLMAGHQGGSADMQEHHWTLPSRRFALVLAESESGSCSRL